VLDSKKIKTLILEVMRTLAPDGSTEEEEPIYQFKNGVPKQRTKEAIKRLIKIAKELKVKGTLIYENVMSNLAFAGKA
jgi:hemerythrin superfamily protein